MSADVIIPFVHTAFLVVTALVVGVVLQVLPTGWSARKSWLVAVPAGAGFAGMLAWGGWLPWRGEMHLAAYALFLVGGFALAWWLLRQRADVLGLTTRQMSDAVLLALVLGVLGARARYVWERWDALKARHGEAVWSVALDLDRGGAVWYGGVLLATLGVVVLMRRWRVRLTVAADVILPAVLLGLAVGRIGCWVNGCCFGAPTDLPWAVTCPRPPFGPVHPAPLYESIAVAAMGGWLWWWWTPARMPGLTAAMAMIGYGGWRCFNEGLRGDHDAFTTWPLVGRITTSQGTSLVLMGAGFLLLLVAWRRRRHLPRAG